MNRLFHTATRALACSLLCTCCSSDVAPDAAGSDVDASHDASMEASDSPSLLDAREAGTPDSPRNDVPRPMDARSLPDAQFEEGEWLPFPDLAPECALRVARDPEAAVGRWDFEPCGPVEGCRALRQHSFVDRPGERVFFEAVDGERLVAGTAIDLPPGGQRGDLFFLQRSGFAEMVTRSVIFSASDPDLRSSLCRVGDLALRGPDTMLVLDDLRMADEDLRGARYLLQRSMDGAWSLYATLTHDGLSGNSPQNVRFSRDLAADQVAPSNRIVSILPDGTYRFTEPAPPFERVRVHSVPSVVGEHWIASAGISGTRNGLFMSHLGEPSVRVRDVDAVGEVAANETDIVWLEGSHLTEGTRLDDTTLWHAPWRPGPIDPAEARPVRAIADVAQLFPESVNPGHGYLRIHLGPGYVAVPNAMATRCHVIRLSDGAMATIEPPGYLCQRVLDVTETEVALGLVEVGDTAGTTSQLWFVPMTSLAFVP